MPLVEAVHVNAGLNASLSRADRQAAIERSAGAAVRCPLLQDGACKAFEFRPLRCRLKNLPKAQAGRLEAERTPALAKASREIYQALTGQFLPEDFPRFSMADAVTGRYVQVFFNWQKALGQP